MTSKNLDTLNSSLQKTTDDLHKWASSNGLSFSSHKTKAITFSSKRKTPPPCTIKLNNSLIQTSHNIKILGMTLDRRLSWKEHVENLKTKSQNSLNILKMTAHTKWGGSRDCLKNLYSSLTLSKLDYGSIIYDSAKPNLLQKLNTVQNTALRLISGAMYTSPIASLHAESNIPPLQYRRKFLTLKYLAKITSKPSNPTHHRTVHPNFTQLYQNKDNSPKPIGIRYKNLLQELDFQLPSNTTNELETPPWLINYRTKKQKDYKMKKQHKKWAHLARKAIQTSWQKEWQNLHSTSKLYKIKPVLKDWKSSYREKRREEVILERLRIGHSLATHKHLFEKTPTPICETCRENLTIEHILTSCKKYEIQREHHQLQNKTLPQILANDEQTIQNLLKFVEESKLIDIL